MCLTLILLLVSGQVLKDSLHPKEQHMPCPMETLLGRLPNMEVEKDRDNLCYENQICIICSSRNYPYPPHGRSMEIPRGWGISKAKFLEGTYGA